MLLAAPLPIAELPAERLALTTHRLPAARADEALALWRLLEGRLESRSLASSAVWIQTWIRHYGDLVPFEFHFAEADGLTRGAALITRGQGQKLGPFPIRTLHLGSAGEPPAAGSVCVEYNRVLVEPLYRAEFQQELLAQLQAESDWDQLRLDGFTEHDLAPWQALLPTAEVRWRESRYFDFTAVRAGGGDVISALGRSTRSNIRRRLKQYDNLRCDWATNPDEAASWFQDLIELHQARWRAVGESGAFARSRFANFQQELCLRLQLDGRGVLCRIRDDRGVVGVLFLLRDGDRLLDYLSGFVSFDERPSPGMISHYLCMEEALRRGFDAYDFLVGDKRHKENLSNACEQLGWLSWSRPSWKLRGIATLQQLHARWKSFRRARTNFAGAPVSAEAPSSD